jgi:hypothetical protein
MMPHNFMHSAKINFELAADQCTPEHIQAWMDVLEDAVNWSHASDCKLFYDPALSVVGASMPVGPAAIDMLEAGAALGAIKLEVLSSDLHFQNLWLSIQERGAKDQA